MYKIFIVIIFILLFVPISYSQVGIGTTTPNSSSVLDIESNDKGVLIPRLSSLQRNNIITPAKGLLVFDNDTITFWFYDGTQWVELISKGLVDTDNDTEVKVEESSDEDIIRFYLEGTQKWIMNNNTLESINTGNSLFIGEGAGVNDNLSNNRNTFLGKNSGNSNNSGFYNTAVGYEALFSNDNGFYNTAIGYQALNSNNSGVYNTSVGFGALRSNLSGGANSAIGLDALSNNSSGQSNHAGGYAALYGNTSGGHNTAVGSQALKNNITGSDNTAIGYNAGPNLITDLENTTSIGNGAIPTADNSVRLGNSIVTSIGGFSNWTNVSDGRFKKNVKENVSGLDFILKLRPVTYNLDINAIAKFYKTPDSLRSSKSELYKTKELQSGFIAQEVEKTSKAIGYDFHGVDKPMNSKSHYGLRYAEFTVPIVKAIQEQQVMIDQLIIENKNLNKELKEMSKAFQHSIKNEKNE